MKKGAEKIIATSPHGAVTAVQGLCLYLALGHTQGHYRILEQGRVDQDNVLVGVVPTDWAVELVPNQ